MKISKEKDDLIYKKRVELMGRFVVSEAVTYMNLKDHAVREKKQRTFPYILVK